MASKKNKIQEAVIPSPEETGDFNSSRETVTYRGAETILGGDDVNKPIVNFTATGGIKSNWLNAPYYQPATAIYNKETGAISAEAITNPEYMSNMAKDISDMYAFVNPRLQDDKRRNALFKQIYNEISLVPGYIGQGAASMGVSAYDAILSLNTNSIEKDWEDYVNTLDQNDPDLQNLYVALNNAYAKGFNPLYMSANKLKGIDGKPLSDKSLEIFDRYKKLLQTRQDDAYRQKALEIFEQSDAVPTIGTLGEKIEGDKSTVGHMLVELAAKDVAGSLAVAWSTGQGWLATTRGAAKIAYGTSKVLRNSNKLKSAYLATRSASQFLAQASVAGAEAAVATPVFLSQYNNIRNMALLQGLSYGEACSIAFGAGAAEAGLEFAGFKFFKRLYSRNGAIWNMIMSDIIPEALQETSQTVAENIITEVSGLTDKTFSEIMYEVGMSALAGAMGGAMFGDVKGISSRLVGTKNWADKRLSKFSKEQIQQTTKEVIEEKAKITPEQKQEVQQQVQPEQQVVNQEQTAVPLPQVNIPTEVEQSNIQEDIKQSEQEEVKTEETKQDYSYGETPEGKEELKQTIEDVYGQYFDLYKELALKQNKNLTEKQLIVGFSAVADQVQRANNGELGQMFDNAINNTVAWIPVRDKLINENAKRINEILTKKGYDPKKAKEIRQKLLSKDWATKHNAQWEMAEDLISDMYEEAGLKQYAPLAYQELRAFLYDATFLDPNLSITGILQKQKLNIYNLQVASLIYDQASIPEEFRSILSNIRFDRYDSPNADTGRTRTRASLSEIVNTANRVVELLVNPKENALQINNELYVDNIDPDASKTAADIEFLAMVEETLMNPANSPFIAKQELSGNDYKRMALMRQMGMSQGEIMYEFGIETSDADAKARPDEAYIDAVRNIFPEPDDTQVSKILNSFNGRNQDIQGLFAPYGEDKKTGQKYSTAITRGSGMAAVHETGHYTLTNFVTRIMEAQKRDLLPDVTNNQAISYIVNLQNYLRNQIVSGNKSLTEAQFQETVLEAIQNYFAGKINSDPALQKLLAKTDEAFQKTVANGINQSVYKSLPEDRKFMLDSAIANMLENNTPTMLIKKATALEDIAFDKVFVGGTTPEETTNILYDKIKDVIDNTFVPNGDKFLVEAEGAKFAGDLLALKMIALNVSNAAKEFSFKTLFQNEYDKVANQKALKNSYGEDQTDYFLYQHATLQYPSDTTLWEDVKEFKKDMSGAELWQTAVTATKATGNKIVEGIKDVVQSISNAAYSVDNQLGSMLERSYYDLGQQVIDVKRDAAKLKSLIDPVLGKDPQKYTQWVMSYANYGKDMREKSIQFLRDNVSNEAADTFAKMWQRIEDIKTELISVGLSAELFYNDDYWPQSVKNHKGLMEYLGVPEVKSETTKLADRLFYNAVRTQAKKTGYQIKEGETLTEVADKLFTEEEQKKLYQDIVNKVNGFFRENIDDSHKVSSFFPRIVLEKTIDIMQFYHDPLTAYVKYCESMYRTIMMRKLTGFVNENTLSNQTGKVGRYLKTLPKDEATQEAISNFERKFKKFVNVYKSEPNSFWNYLRQINNITTLGSFVNTLNQTMDFVPFLEQYGVANVAQAIRELKNGVGIRIADIGVESSSETYRTAVENEPLKKAQTWVWDKTKFSSFDEFIKNTGINAARIYFQKALNSDVNSQEYKDAMRYINECYPEDAFIDVLTEQPGLEAKTAENTRQAVIEDLKAGNSTYDTGFVLFHMLGKTQPINPSVTAISAVAGGPVAKLCMQFTAPMLRQLEWLSDYIRKGLKSKGAAWVAKELLKLASFLVMIGLPKEVITNAIRGRSTDITKAGLIAPLHIIGVNEYVMSIAKRDGLFQALGSAYRPGFNIEANVLKDLINFVSFKDYQGNTWKNVPVAGDVVYGWLLGGRKQSLKMKTNLIGNEMNDVKNNYRNAVNRMRQ